MWTSSQIKLSILQEVNKLFSNDCNTEKTKHIDMKYNLVREQDQRTYLAMIHLPTEDVTLDILTKALTPSPFIHLRLI